jgi:S1-C subfamily serine protease
MNQHRHNKIVLGGFVVVVIMMFLGFFLLYDFINENNSRLVGQVSVKSNQIESHIDSLQEQTQEEMLLLQNQMLTNFKKLETTINQETGKVKLDLESQLKDVSTKFDEKSIELDDKISSINVQSSDFSGIIDDVIKGVVSVKTNKGSGSGVIYDQKGYILTNRHVIEDASSVFVVDYEGIRYPATIVAVANNVDLATLKIDKDLSFTALRFANDDEIRVGSKVIAVGNPLGLSFTVTEGIISSKKRMVEGQIFIQTDVPINPGNSGGPIVNSRKRIVGINTFKFSNSEGLGFAIPSDVAKEFAELVEITDN